MDVHSKLRELLVCQYLLLERESLRFRMLCKSEIPPAERSSVEDILNYLERTGKFSEGNYDFVSRKVQDIDVAITYLIQEAEKKIEEIKAKSLLVIAKVTEVDPIQLEKETREEVDLILLAVSEKLLCRSEDDDEDAGGLWERYQDLNTLSDDFLNIWHKEFCKCRKQYGRRLLLQYVRQGARLLELGENKFDRFRRNIVPKLLATLKKGANITLHVFANCGASLVSVVPSSVMSYWVFDSIDNLDKLWRKYKEEGLHVDLQKLFNTKDVLGLFNVDKIYLTIVIKESNYLQYRQILEMKAAGTGLLTASMESLAISPPQIPFRPHELNEPIEPRRQSDAPEHPGPYEPPENPEAYESLESHEPSKPPTPYEPSDPTGKYDVREHSGPYVLPKPKFLEPPEIFTEKSHERITSTFWETGYPLMKSSLVSSSKPLMEAMLPSTFVPMRKRLYEINKQFSETPTVTWYLFKSDDIGKREHLFLSVCLKEYNGPIDESFFFHPKFMRKMENIPSEIFCTSDELPWQWKGLYSKTYHISRTKSTCVFILGEAGCGKTSYCKHLLSQWCQGQDLRKFDNVFYVDTSVLHTSKTSMSDLISAAVFGNATFSESQVTLALRNEKCLILIDGGEYFRESLLREIDLEESFMEYCNCVFVFLLTPLQFLKSFYLLDIWQFNVHFIQLSGLDEKGMTSFYSNFRVRRGYIKQSKSPHGRMKADFQKLMKMLTLQKETNEPDTVGTKPLFFFKSKGESDTQAYIEQNPSESEQRLKKAGIVDFAQFKPQTERYVSEHDRKEFEFYKMKGMLEKGLRGHTDSIMKIPMLGSICVALLADGKALPRNFTNLYLCLVDKLIGGHSPLRKGERGMKVHGMFISYENVHRHVETLLKLGKVAFDSIFSPVLQSLNYENLGRYLDETEIMFSMKTGLLVPIQTKNDEESSKSYVRFLHRTIQDTLFAINIVIEKEEALDTCCQQLTSIDFIIDLSHVIMMVCGLNPNQGCRITRRIQDVLDKVKTVCRHREVMTRNYLIRELYNLQLRWYAEYKDNVIGSDTIHSFYISDIYVDDDTDKETITKTIALLSDQNVIVRPKSLYFSNLPSEIDLTGKVLNDFMAFNTSLESIYINEYQIHRSIVPLSFPFLRVLKLWHIHIQPAYRDDEARKSLLYNLPMLQRLDVFEIKLNKRLLGLTSDEGKMRKLNSVLIYGIDMSGQSIELAPDMTDIENIHLHCVKMSPQGWMKFIRSLVNIHHSYLVNISDSDIDAESQDMVRTNKIFGVMQDDSHCFEFCRTRKIFTVKTSHDLQDMPR